jgi:hypothetical protein
MRARTGVLTIFAAAMAGFAAAPAMAQADLRQATDACLALPTDAERVACIRAALAADESATAAPAAPAAPAVAQQAEDEEDDDGFLGLGILGGGDERPAAVVASQSEFAAGLGAEQVSGRDDMREAEEAVRVQAAVVSVREWIPGVAQFELDNGQVWRQIGADTQRPRVTRSETVELYGSWAGGYRMHVPERNQTLQVERVQ